MKDTRYFVSAVITLFALSSCSISQTSESASERILVASLQPGNWDIYYFSRLDEGPQRLTNHPGLDYDPVLSPNGRWLVFTSERNGSPDLFVLDLNNPGPPRLLIDSETMEDQAAFSPDGHRLAFVSTLEGNADIFVIPFQPKQTLRMSMAVNVTRNPHGDFRPAFSPDGKKIAFSSDRDSDPTGPSVIRRRQGEIYLMDIDGQNLRRLTFSELETQSPSPFDSSPGWDGSPVWAPDGRRIFFYSGRSGGFRIWSMNADGSDPRPVSPPGRIALSPTPIAGDRVAFTTKIDEVWRIVSVSYDGTDQRFECDGQRNYWGPKFSSATHAMVCYAPGPTHNKLPPTEAGILGEGPLFTPDYPVEKSLPDRTVQIFAIRDFTAAIHPRQNRIARLNTLRDSDFNPSATNDLIVSEMDRSKADTIYRETAGSINAPDWAQDGSWLTFTRGEAFAPPEAEADIWKIRPDGNGATNLTPHSPGNDGFSDVSGDGRHVVFRSGRTGNFDIYLMDIDGNHVRNLTLNDADDTFPAFSPRNDQIVFTSNRDGELDAKMGIRTFDIYTLDIGSDGSPGDLKRVTTHPGQDAHARYSPDGKWIVFTSERGGINDEEPLVQSVVFAPQMYGEIYALNLTDATLVRLTHNKWEDGLPTWGHSVTSQ